MLTMPRPPASATAAASAGVATPPIPACWIGTRQPTSSVKAVLSIVTASLHESGFDAIPEEDRPETDAAPRRGNRRELATPAQRRPCTGLHTGLSPGQGAAQVANCAASGAARAWSWRRAAWQVGLPGPGQPSRAARVLLPPGAATARSRQPCPIPALTRAGLGRIPGNSSRAGPVGHLRAVLLCLVPTRGQCPDGRLPARYHPARPVGAQTGTPAGQQPLTSAIAAGLGGGQLIAAPLAVPDSAAACPQVRPVPRPRRRPPAWRGVARLARAPVPPRIPEPRHRLPVTAGSRQPDEPACQAQVSPPRPPPLPGQATRPQPRPRPPHRRPPAGRTMSA